MKKTIINILILFILIVGVFFAGCSKSNNSTNPTIKAVSNAKVSNDNKSNNDTETAKITQPATTTEVPNIAATPKETKPQVAPKSTTTQTTTQKTPTKPVVNKPISQTKQVTTNSFYINITYPIQNSIIEVKPLTITWTVSNKTLSKPYYSIYLDDLTDKKQTYSLDLGINSNFDEPIPTNDGESWTIPVRYIDDFDWTLQSGHKYELTIDSDLIYNGPGLSPYKDCWKKIDFSCK